MSAPQALSLVLGCTLGLGLWSLAATLPSFRRPRLADRVAPYILDVSPAAREHVRRRTVDPLPVIGSLAAPVIGAFSSLLSRLFGGPETAALRLRQAGSASSVERLRAEQVISAMLGGAVGIVVVLLSASRLPPVLTPAIPVLAAFSGAALRDQVLRRAASARVSRMTDELPTVLEFLTLSLSAGEGIHDALRRVARTSSGELAAEFAGVLSRVGAGVPLMGALDELSTGLRMPPLSRAIDQITSAVERGTPLAGVLRAQAQDARGEAKNRLLERAGRNEIAMLIPLVFLILPLTVVIAIFPGLFVLQAGF
ncbi:type II secretion system F family protein [Leifsonia sp. YIM 134122]|uniref:Type II secretion system F family protein n=1 Tax=Leifsonia stereocauli TaxID=3134136 RepID=A0ABU9W0B9_9MICO